MSAQTCRLSAAVIALAIVAVFVGCGGGGGSGPGDQPGDCTPPQISEATVANDPDPVTAAGAMATITARITDPKGVTDATVVVTEPDGGTEQVAMALTDGDDTDGTWTAEYNIPANTTTEDQEYGFRLSATNTDDCTSQRTDAGVVVVPAQTVSGKAIDGLSVESGSPWDGVTIRIVETGALARTDSNGEYSIPVADADTYHVRAQKKGALFVDPPGGEYAEREVQVPGNCSSIDFCLVSPPQNPSGDISVCGFVYGADGNPVEGITVTVPDVPNPATGDPKVRSDQTDQNGEYLLYLPPGDWTVTPQPNGFAFDPVSLEFSAEGINMQLPDFSATPN